MTALAHAIHPSTQPPPDRPTVAETAAFLPSRRAIWVGRILSGLPALFLLLDATMKVLKLGPAVEGTVKIGYPEGVIVGLGLVQLVCLVTYLIPRTAVLGAVLWTGYLGGAVATHVRVGDPLFTHVLFPVYVAVLLWAGLWLRDVRLRTVLPARGSFTIAR